MTVPNQSDIGIKSVYEATVPDLIIPSDNISMDAWLTQLRQMAERDLPATRQAALLRLIWQESYLIREGLIARVEALLGRDCFGASPHAAFHCHVATVRRALAQAGHRLVYSSQSPRKGYYVEGRPLLCERVQRLIAGAVAEVDSRQIAMSRHLTPAQQFQQGLSMTQLAERVAAYRLRQRQPHLSEEQARLLVRKRIAI